MKKALIITYYWPPAGGPGVQRVLKFAKYLPEYGWEPIILTVKNGEYPALDETLINEVSPEIKVFHSEAKGPFALYRRFSGDTNKQPVPVGILSQKDLPLKKRFAKWIRLNFVIPDAKTGWIKPAVQLGQKIIEQEKPDVIFSSSPPPTVHRIAKRLSETANLPWVADLRDPWSKIHYYANNSSWLANKLDAKMEKNTLDKATQVTTVSAHFGKLIDVNKNKLHIISNGYDPKDIMIKKSNNKKPECFSMAYVGGLNEDRFYPEIFYALKEFSKEHKISKNDISLTLAGKIPEKYSRKIEEILKDHIQLNIKGYISHLEAIELMRTTRVLLLFMEKVDNYSDDIELIAIVMDNRHSGFTTIMQGFYEYMKLLDKQQQMEKEQDEYKKYLELKAKFERN